MSIIDQLYNADYQLSTISVYINNWPIINYWLSNETDSYFLVDWELWPSLNDCSALLCYFYHLSCFAEWTRKSNGQTGYNSTFSGKPPWIPPLASIEKTLDTERDKTSIATCTVQIDDRMLVNINTTSAQITTRQEKSWTKQRYDFCMYTKGLFCTWQATQETWYETVCETFTLWKTLSKELRKFGAQLSFLALEHPKKNCARVERVSLHGAGVQQPS